MAGGQNQSFYNKNNKRAKLSYSITNNVNALYAIRNKLDWKFGYYNLLSVDSKLPAYLMLDDIRQT